MVKTGLSLLEVLSIVGILMPLFPLFIILIRKLYQYEILNFLMVLCLITFIQKLVSLPLKLSADLVFARVVFELAQFTILFFILKTIIHKGWLQQAINVFLISFLSVVITISISTGVVTYYRNISIIQACCLIVITLIALFQLKKNHQTFIFLSPMFWIAGGTLCYYSMFLLIELLTPYKQVTPSAIQEKLIFLSTISIVQFAFYTIAACVRQAKNPDSNSGYF